MVIKRKQEYLLKPALLCFAGFLYLTGWSQDVVSVQYTNNQAVSIAIVSSCTIEKTEVRLRDSPVKILGDMKVREGSIFFKPSFPFSSDLVYEVYCGDDLMTSFTPVRINSTSPYVVSIFPIQDTLPENLLKMHIVFSQPMVTGKSYPHISITENGKEIKPFLELEAELWNEDQTVFTLWLDPGRIKRDLTPNQLYGNPLTKGNIYELKIDSLWKDQNSQPMLNSFIKNFQVGIRDESRPSPAQWRIHASNDKIKIKFNEPLDYLLINHSLTLWKNEELIPVKTRQISNLGLELIPNKPLVNGTYKIKVNPKLEDLAGNNLIKLFDTDLNVGSTTKPITEINITVKNSTK